MSTDTTLVIKSTSSKNTEKFGEQVGKNLKGGETIELKSDLGGGKTTFVRGLARGAGSNNHVASPSFTISREYSVKGRTFHKIMHFDFHRLDDPGLVRYALEEYVDDQKVVVVIEWADKVKKVLPKDRLAIEISNEGEHFRNLRFSCSNEYQYLVKGFK